MKHGTHCIEMAQALWGSIEHFDPPTEGWQEYVERIEYLFEVNGLTGEDKASQRRSMFLTLVGPATFKLLDHDQESD